MLVLTISVGQKLCIGDDVFVSMNEMNGKGKMRVAITAPKEKNIYVQADVPASENIETESSGSCRTDWKALRELCAANSQAVNTKRRKRKPTGTATKKPVRSVKELHPLCVGS